MSIVKCASTHLLNGTVTVDPIRVRFHNAFVNIAALLFHKHNNSQRVFQRIHITMDL